MYSRDRYVQELIEGEGNGLVKIIIGIRRCEKSYLLNVIFKNHLVKELGIPEENVIQFAFDSIEGIAKLDEYLPDQPTTIKIGNQRLVNYRKFLRYVEETTKGDGNFYFLLDEVQNLEDFVRVLNGFLRHENYDIYVTGSNSRFLSSQVDTEFVGRGDRIHLLPLTFSEYLTGVSIDKYSALNQYIRYGGIPLVQNKANDEKKSTEAKSIYRETYLKDVKDRHPNVDLNRLNDTLNVVASMISTKVNPPKIASTFKGVYNVDIAKDIVDDYISWFEERIC